MKISKDEARDFLIRYQHLQGGEALRGTAGIVKYIQKVGCIQYDPLDIVGRNAELVLQSRIAGYRTGMLNQALYKERLLIDGWDKMMAVYAITDWPFFHRVRKQCGIDAVGTMQYRNSADALLYTDTVLEAIQKNGPLMPRQVKTASAGPTSWGHKSLSGAAMDYLWTIGRLGVHNKVNANKVYDLIENIIPGEILDAPDPFATEHDFCKWYVHRRIGSVGMLWNKNGGGWLGQFLGDKKMRVRVLDELVDEGLLRLAEVEGIADKFYIRSGDWPLPERDSSTRQMRFIAPLDNLLWDRAMLVKIFGFDYQWEVYLPVEKRKYGYYVIPVLYGNRFVARFEPEKSATHMKIKNWWWEEDVEVDDELLSAAMTAMENFAACFEKPEGVHESVRGLLR